MSSEWCGAPRCATDDSGSMQYAEGGERINDLKAMVERVTEVASLFDTDGISIRAINRCLCRQQNPLGKSRSGATKPIGF